MDSNDSNINPKVVAKKFIKDMRYRKLINGWSTKDLKVIIDDRSKAL